jgi:outer membrane protein assembly factor BamB
MNRRDFLIAAVMAGALPSARAAAQHQGGADWTRFGYDIHNTRFNRNEKTISAANAASLKMKWRFDTLDGWPIQSTPTVIGDTLFFGAGGYYYSLNSATGKMNWSFATGLGGEWLANLLLPGTRSSAHYENGRIYFGTGLCNVHCLDAATGKEIWKTAVEPRKEMMASMMFSPVVYNGNVVVGYSGSMAEVVCMHAETGAVRWRFRVVKDVPEKYQTGGASMWTSAAIDEQQNVVYNVTGNAKAYAGPTLYANSLIAHDVDTGELLWHYQAHPQDIHDLDFCAHPMVFDAVSPLRSRGDVRRCVGAGNKANFVCLNRHTGQLYWKASLNQPSANSGPLICATAVAYDRVYIQTASPASRPAFGLTAALNAYTGDVEWLVPNPGLQTSPIAVANGVLYQGITFPAKIEALDAHTGARLWEAAMPSAVRGGITVANGAVYASNGETGAWRGNKTAYPHSVFCFTPEGK